MEMALTYTVVIEKEGETSTFHDVTIKLTNGGVWVYTGENKRFWIPPHRIIEIRTYPSA